MVRLELNEIVVDFFIFSIIIPTAAIYLSWYSSQIDDFI